MAGGRGKRTSAEIYDPAANSWTSAGNMAEARGEHGAALLPDGRVIVIGGIGNLATSEVYNPANNTWASGPSMADGRLRFPTLVLGDGTVVVPGGVGKDGLLAATEIFTP